MWEKETTVRVEQARSMSPDELSGKFVIGELVHP
jgi:hypothetical protein